jgi:hypothetical protein
MTAPASGVEIAGANARVGRASMRTVAAVPLAAGPVRPLAAGPVRPLADPAGAGRLSNGRTR